MALFATALISALGAQPATAADDNVGAIRVSNRAFDDRTVCVTVDNWDGSSIKNDCRNIGVRNIFTWKYEYPDVHAAIKITVSGGGRTYKDTFEANKPAPDRCYRYSASGSFHPAKDCKI